MGKPVANPKGPTLFGLFLCEDENFIKMRSECQWVGKKWWRMNNGKDGSEMQWQRAMAEAKWWWGDEVEESQATRVCSLNFAVTLFIADTKSFTRRPSCDSNSFPTAPNLLLNSNTNRVGRIWPCWRKVLNGIMGMTSERPSPMHQCPSLSHAYHNFKRGISVK